MSTTTVIVGAISGAAGGFATGYLKERVTWASRARDGIVTASEGLIGGAQRAKELGFRAAKADSETDVEAVRSAVQDLLAEMAAARGRTIMFVGPRSVAADLAMALTTRVNIMFDASAGELANALQFGDEAGVDLARDALGEHLDSLDREVDDFAVQMYLAGETPIWRRRFEAYRQRRAIRAAAGS